jgi:hypothetical protein
MLGTPALRQHRPLEGFADVRSRLTIVELQCVVNAPGSIGLSHRRMNAGFPYHPIML